MVSAHAVRLSAAPSLPRRDSQQIVAGTRHGFSVCAHAHVWDDQLSTPLTMLHQTPIHLKLLTCLRNPINTNVAIPFLPAICPHTISIISFQAGNSHFMCHHPGDIRTCSYLGMSGYHGNYSNPLPYSGIRCGKYYRTVPFFPENGSNASRLA